MVRGGGCAEVLRGVRRSHGCHRATASTTRLTNFFSGGRARFVVGRNDKKAEECIDTGVLLKRSLGAGTATAAGEEHPIPPARAPLRA